MNKEVIKVIPDCIEKLGKISPARLREIKDIMSYVLPFSVISGTIYYIHKERITDKKYKHEEKILKMKCDHEEKMAEILNRVEESEDEKDN